MTIKQEKNGTFTVRYAKRHPVSLQSVGLLRKGIKTKAEAARVVKELIVAVAERLTRAVIPTWSQCVDEWQEAARTGGICEATISAYRKCLLAHTIPLWGSRGVDSILQDEVRMMIRNPEKAWSETHRKNMIKYVRAVFKFALEKGYIARIPVPNMKFHVIESLKGGLTEGQARKLLETARAVNHEWYPHWAVALYTGMRNGEIYALRWDCVDLETSVLRVKATWNSKDGYKPPKSWEERVVEIAPALLPLLKRLKLQTGESGFVLPRIEDWDRGEQARVLRTFLAGMGQPAIRFHDLRASWATLLLLKGVEPIKVMAMGGWKDLKTLMKYVRIAAVDIRGATSKLNFHDDSKRDGEVLRFPVESVGGG